MLKYCWRVVFVAYACYDDLEDIGMREKWKTANEMGGMLRPGVKECRRAGRWN